jgi:hypothetical protein
MTRKTSYARLVSFANRTGSLDALPISVSGPLEVHVGATSYCCRRRSVLRKQLTRDRFIGKSEAIINTHLSTFNRVDHPLGLARHYKAMATAMPIASREAKASGVPVSR